MRAKENMRDFSLPNRGGHTIARRLSVKLLQELRGGAFKDATRLPNEMELAQRYGVSRSVIRDALADLEGAGFVARGRGVGTVVNRQIVELTHRVDVKFEYNELILQRGCVPSSDGVYLYQQPASEELAEKLALDVGAPLIVCEKRVKASGTPVIYSIDHLSQALFARVEWRMLDWGSSVFDILAEKCGVEIDSSISHLSAVQGPDGICQKLGLAPGATLIQMDEVGYYKLGHPILHSLGFYTDFFDFSLFRKNF